MTISYSQELRYTCSTCHSSLVNTVWMLVDTQERPDLHQALLDDTLNMHTCANCQSVSAPDGPLLLHDGGARQVYFAVPDAMPEHTWREYAQDLLRHLLQALPEEQHLPYIGDVQLEQGLAGVRRSILRHARRTKRRQPASQSSLIPQATHAPHVQPAKVQSPNAELLDAIEALLACDETAELEAMFHARPILHDPAALTLITTMIDTAERQAETEIARSLRHARSVLLGLQQGRSVEARAILQGDVDDEQEASPKNDDQRLSNIAYQAVLHADTPEGLHTIVRDYPQLLEPWAERAIAERLETAIEFGHEHLAALIEERSAALIDLRNEMTQPDMLRSAIRALGSAKTEQALLEAINTYPALLTEATQQALAELQERSVAQGEERRAALIDERRKMLDEVRQGLEKS